MSSNMSKLRAFALAGIAGAAMAIVASGPAQATLWKIDGILGPNAVDNGFGYSSLHDSTGSNVMTGAILANFGGSVGDSNVGGSLPGFGSYDDVTGSFHASWAIFDNPIGGPIGIMSVSGILKDQGTGAAGTIGGVLNYDIVVGPGALATQLGGAGQHFGQFYFNDKVEFAPAVYDPNTFVADNADNTKRILTLWGATDTTSGGPTTDGNGFYSFGQSLLGADLRFGLSDSGGGTSIPEPAALALMGLGVMGLGAMARRRRAK